MSSGSGTSVRAGGIMRFTWICEIAVEHRARNEEHEQQRFDFRVQPPCQDDHRQVQRRRDAGDDRDRSEILESLGDADVEHVLRAQRDRDDEEAVQHQMIEAARDVIAGESQQQAAGDQNEQQEPALRAAQVRDRRRDEIFAPGTAKFRHELDDRARRAGVGDRHAHRDEPDHRAVCAEIGGPEMPRDENRREHAEEVLGVDAHRREHRVANDARADVHPVTSRSFTITYNPTMLATAVSGQRMRSRDNSKRGRVGYRSRAPT